MDYSDTTVIVPVRDEPAVAEVVRGVSRALHNCRIIVVYKGNVSIPRSEAAAGRLMLVRQRGTGKGNACIQVAKLVNTKIMCFIDGDATYDADDLKKVVERVRHGADLALGNRLKTLNRKAMPAFVEFGNKVITDTANLLYRMHVQDSQTGLRAIKKKVFDALMLKEQYFGMESEMTIKARKMGFRIEEVPIRYYMRVGSSKQMKLVDGIKLLLLDFKFLFD
jgi:hypothetical protein